MTRNSNLNVLQILARMPIFQGLGAERLAEVGRGCQILTLDKGEVIFRVGDQPRGFYHLVSGQIKLAVLSADGDEKVLEILCPVQSFGEPELFSIRPYASFAEAVRPTVVVQVGREVLYALIEEDSRFALRMLQTLANRHSERERDASRRLQTCSERIVDYLLEQAGSCLKLDGATTLELTASKQLIAARLDLSPETLSRTLRSLSDAGLISVCGRRVTLERPIMSRRSGGATTGRVASASYASYARYPTHLAA